MSVAILTQSSKRALKLGLLLKDGRNSSAIHQSSKNESSTASNSTSRHRNLHQLGLSDPIKSIGIIEQESMSPTAMLDPPDPEYCLRLSLGITADRIADIKKSIYKKRFM